MKDFLKFTLATVTGLVLTGTILFLLSIISIFGLIATSEHEIKIKPKSYFTLHLDKLIEDRSIEDPLTMLMGEEYASVGLDDILKSIKKAKESNNIQGIYLEASGKSNTSTAILEEIRRALLDFKESGKNIIAYGDIYTQGEYYLCSVADKIILNPQGSIEWVGLSSQHTFYTRLLEKAGVEIQIFKVGTYKSAVEPFIETKMSEANREQTTAYISSIWNKLSEDIAVSRNLTPSQLNDYANQMLTLGETSEFINAGLADTLLYKDETKAYLKQLAGIDDSDELNTITLDEMKRVKHKTPLDKSGNVIAVYYAIGEIVDNTSTSLLGQEATIVGSQTIKDLSELREDDNVKAVVLRVNSPGGSAYASEQIWNEIVKLKAQKPVIVSMGATAASGGYYISCAADSIFAESTTLTGSIGIFGMIPNIENLVNDKLNLDFDIVKTNLHSDMGSINRAMNESEKKILQQHINRGYDLFVKRCADGRGVSKEAIQQVAEGRVWTGEMAQKLSLVDQIGGINEAIKAASEKANIENYSILAYPQQPDMLSCMMSNGKDRYIQTQIKNVMGEHYHLTKLINRLQYMAPIQAHTGFDPQIKL